MLLAPYPFTVRIDREDTGQDSAGGNAPTWVQVETDVPCLISAGDGSRSERFDQQSIQQTWTVAGDSANLARGDVRFYVLTGTNAGIVGLYLRPTGPSPHGPSPLGLAVPAGRYRATCEILVQ